MLRRFRFVSWATLATPGSRGTNVDRRGTSMKGSPLTDNPLR